MCACICTYTYTRVCVRTCTCAVLMCLGSFNKIVLPGQFINNKHYFLSFFVLLVLRQSVL